MRLESGADDSLPFQADVKKLAECELHSPIHSVHKKKLLLTECNPDSLFGHKRTEWKFYTSATTKNSYKEVTCNSVTRPVGRWRRTNQIIFFVAKHSLPGFCVPGTCGSSCKSVKRGVSVIGDSFLTFLLSLTTPQCNCKLETMYHTSYSLCKIEEYVFSSWVLIMYDDWLYSNTPLG